MKIIKNTSASYEYVVSVIFVSGNKVLMQLRDNKPGIFCPGYWCIPGGSVEEEDIKTAAIREFKEETGYQLRNPKLFWIEYYRVTTERVVKAYRFFDIYDNLQPISCFEGQKMKFLTLKEIAGLKLVPGQIEAIKKAIKLAELGINNPKVHEIPFNEK